MSLVSGDAGVQSAGTAADAAGAKNAEQQNVTRRFGTAFPGKFREMDQNIRAWMEERRTAVEDLLKRRMDSYRGDAPEILADAMSYSLLAGGKRLRPMLVIAAAEACGASGSEKAVLDAAVGIEMIHTYSLIHDDLPSMDNDEFRRGMPTNHRKFGEALALLAGDALLTEAFAVISEGSEPCRAGLCALFARHAGARGMVGGQVEDTVASCREDTVDFLDRINRRKTGDLLALACAAGACAAGASAAVVGDLEKVGFLMGLAFQQWDDVLDVEGDPQLMGKAVGNDAQQHKLTYPGLIGLEETRNSARKRIQEAKALIASHLSGAVHLSALADAMIERKN